MGWSQIGGWGMGAVRVTEGRVKMEGHIITYTPCLSDSPLDLQLEWLPTQSLTLGGLTSSHGRVFCIPHGMCPISPHTYSLKSHSRGSCWHSCGMYPQWSHQLGVPKIMPPRYHHYQIPLSEPLGILTAPDIITLLEPFRFHILKPSNCWSHNFFPAKEFTHFVLCSTTQIPKQCSQALLHLVEVSVKQTEIIDTIKYSKPFQLPRLVVRAILDA